MPPSCIRDVWGVAKVYETYVGAKQFEEPDQFLKRLEMQAKSMVQQQVDQDRLTGWISTHLKWL